MYREAIQTFEVSHAAGGTQGFSHLPAFAACEERHHGLNAETRESARCRGLGWKGRKTVHAAHPFGPPRGRHLRGNAVRRIPSSRPADQFRDGGSGPQDHRRRAPVAGRQAPDHGPSRRNLLPAPQHCLRGLRVLSESALPSSRCEPPSDIRLKCRRTGGRGQRAVPARPGRNGLLVMGKAAGYPVLSRLRRSRCRTPCTVPPTHFGGPTARRIGMTSHAQGCTEPAFVLYSL